MLEVKLVRDEEVKKWLRRLPMIARERARNVVKETALNVQREAKKAAPVDTGRLRSSVRVRSWADWLAADVYTEVDYAHDIEFGTPPHLVSPAVLQPWARRKFTRGMSRKEKIPASWAIATGVSKKIALSGTRPDPFLFPAWEKERALFLARMTKVFKGLGE